jgi:6-pyruvoyltetrahydropterin/6-carboxytetrahydropterin synthase
MTSMLVTRRIEIDAGHRIMLHGSKCRHLHGHRYAIEATARAARGRLHDSGEQAGMLLDFGFLKQEMEAAIDAACDHGFISALADIDVLRMFAPVAQPFDDWLAGVRVAVERDGYLSTTDCRLGSKLYVVPFHPTAEELARHWFHRLKKAVHHRSDGYAELDRLRVWETPNCWAEYSEDA